MSKVSSRKIIEIDDLIQKGGKEGVRLLLLFKLLKTRVEEEVRTRYPTAIIEEKTLDKICIQRAYELTKLKKERPTEKDFEELLSALGSMEKEA